MIKLFSENFDILKTASSFWVCSRITLCLFYV